jgi:hypothetical protein
MYVNPNAELGDYRRPYRARGTMGLVGIGGTNRGHRLRHSGRSRRSAERGIPVRIAQERWRFP